MSTAHTESYGLYLLPKTFNAGFLKIRQSLRARRHSLIMLPRGSKSGYNLMGRKQWPCQQTLKKLKAYTHFKGPFAPALSLPKAKM